MINYKDIVVEVAGNFLTDEFPEDFNDMPEHELIDYVSSITWEPLQDMSGEEILECIYSSANGIKTLLERNGIKVV